MDSNPFKHPLWDPNAAARAEVTTMQFARKRARICWLVMLVSLALGIYAAADHIQTVLAGRPVIVSEPSGWVFQTEPVPFRTTDDQLHEIWNQIIEAHFARTEKGSLPTLGDFSTPDTLEGVDRLLERSKSNAFVISLVVVEGRLESKTKKVAEYQVRGRLTVVDRQNTASSEIFLSTVFAADVPRADNPTGWRLAGVNAMTRQQFFSAEREAVRTSIFRPVTPAPKK